MCIYAYIHTHRHPLWVFKATECCGEGKEPKARNLTTHVDALLLISMTYVYTLKSSVFLFMIKYAFLFLLCFFLDLPIKTVEFVSD